MGNVDKAPEVSGKDKAIGTLAQNMPDAQEQNNAKAKGDAESIKTSFTIDDLKHKYPTYSRVVNPNDHNDIVTVCRSKIDQVNKEQADSYNAEEIKRAEKENRDPKLIKPEPIKPADSVTHLNRDYDPRSDKIVVTQYAYGVDTNGNHLMLLGKVEERQATDADKKAMGIETGDNTEALSWAEAGIRNPESLDEAEGQRVLNAIAQAGGARIRKNEDNIVYSREQLRQAQVHIKYNAFYAVQLRGKKYYFKGTGIKG